LLGFLVTALVLAIALWRVRGTDGAQRLPRLGMVSALMLVGMMAEIAIIGYHVNLSVLTGILLGPWLGFVAAFLVNIILALFGHGGVTVIGLNALIIGSETMLGWLFFRALKARFAPRVAAAIAVVLTLALSTTLMVGVIALTQTQPALAFEGPGGDVPLLRFELFAAEKESPLADLDLARFAALVYGLGAIGWALEAAFVALVVGFFARTRPDLIDTDPRGSLSKDEKFGTRAD
jgi:cobalt/nickel transport system permease protein